MSLNFSIAAVLDASAVLAYLQNEPGHQIVEEALRAEAVTSAVNLSEVCTKMVATGQKAEPVVSRLLALGLHIQPFFEEDAITAASICPEFGTFFRRQSLSGLGIAPKTVDYNYRSSLGKFRCGSGSASNPIAPC